MNSKWRYTWPFSSTLGENLQEILPRLNKGSNDIMKERNVGEDEDFRFKSFLATREPLKLQLTLVAVSVSDEPNISWMHSSLPVWEARTIRKETLLASTSLKDSWIQESRLLSGRQLISYLQITSRHPAHPSIKNNKQTNKNKKAMDPTFLESNLQFFSQLFTAWNLPFIQLFIPWIFSLHQRFSGVWVYSNT